MVLIISPIHFDRQDCKIKVKDTHTSSVVVEPREPSFISTNKGKGQKRLVFNDFYAAGDEIHKIIKSLLKKNPTILPFISHFRPF